MLLRMNKYVRLPLLLIGFSFVVLEDSGNFFITDVISLFNYISFLKLTTNSLSSMTKGKDHSFKYFINCENRPKVVGEKESTLLIKE